MKVVLVLFVQVLRSYIHPKTMKIKVVVVGILILFEQKMTYGILHFGVELG